MCAVRAGRKGTIRDMAEDAWTTGTRRLCGDTYVQEDGNAQDTYEDEEVEPSTAVKPSEDHPDLHLTVGFVAGFVRRRLSPTCHRVKSRWCDDRKHEAEVSGDLSSRSRESVATWRRPAPS